MYPHPELHSFIQDSSPCVSKKILNSTIEKAMLKHDPAYDPYPSKVFRLASTQPECFAPHVDVTRAPLAWGPFALPKLKKELRSELALVVRQAVTTLGDLLVNPEKLMEAVCLRIHDRVAELLVARDPYVRERAALIHVVMGSQAAGQEAVLSNCVAVSNLFEGLDDQVVPVRFKMAQAIEALAHHGPLADEFNCNHFVETITSKLLYEQDHILLVFLDTLKLLLQRDYKLCAIQYGTFAALVKLLKRTDEEILCGALACLTILCEDPCGKEKADEMDLMCKVKKFIKDKRESINTEAGRLSAFITVTTHGKLRFLELELMTPYLLLASGKCCCSSGLLLWIIKTLTNVAEAPEGRRLLCEKHYTLIENIETGSELMKIHKEKLLEVVRWKP